MSTATADLSPAAEGFVERLGVALEFFGLSRTAGRILAYLIYHEGPVSFDHLAGALSVSRGGVSTNTRQLQLLGLIERRSKPGVRGDYFALAPDSQARFLEAWLSHVGAIEHIIRDTLAAVGSDEETSRTRLTHADSFYKSVRDTMSACIREWDERTSSRRGPGTEPSTETGTE